MDWNILERKNIFVKTRDSGVYSGIVEEIFENNGRFFIRITDKFGSLVIIDTSEIIKLNEESKSKNSLNKTS